MYDGLRSCIILIKNIFIYILEIISVSSAAAVPESSAGVGPGIMKVPVSPSEPRAPGNPSISFKLTSAIDARRLAVQLSSTA